MSKKLSIGTRFTLTEDAIENYGERYRGQVFTVRQWFNKYVPPSLMHLDGNEHGHPGYDNLSGLFLYEADGFPGALYDWEIAVVTQTQPVESFLQSLDPLLLIAAKGVLQLIEEPETPRNILLTLCSNLSHLLTLEQQIEANKLYGLYKQG